MRRLAFLVLFLVGLTGAAWGAPPTVDVPAEVPAKGDYVTVVPKTNAKTISYLGFSGVDPFPAEFLKDAKAFILPVRGLREGRYEFAGVASANDEHTVFRFVVVVGHAPKPPTPPDPITPPDPVTPNVDAELVAKFKTAISADVLAGQGSKEKAAALGVVFESGAALLDLGDPAISPKTVGELYTKMVNASVAKAIPRPPYLKNTRAVVDANVPLLNGQTALTPEIKSQFQTRYRAIAAALAEASK